MQITSDDKQQFVTIDDGASVIDHQHPITITIESDTQVGMLGEHRSLQLTHMGRAAVFIDIQTVWLR
ncbi:hypothetical protein D3C81_1891530 [compost metagenome]